MVDIIDFLQIIFELLPRPHQLRSRSRDPRHRCLAEVLPVQTEKMTVILPSSCTLRHTKANRKRGIEQSLREKEAVKREP